jgi:hypothetical protein
VEAGAGTVLVHGDGGEEIDAERGGAHGGVCVCGVVFLCLVRAFRGGNGGEATSRGGRGGREDEIANQRLGARCLASHYYGF